MRTRTCAEPFLATAKLYLEGSKAPDNEFKDFNNHVLTRATATGRGAEKVRSWYQHLVEAFSQQDWHTAVYCAGVLSHYYTDPDCPSTPPVGGGKQPPSRSRVEHLQELRHACCVGEREFRRVDVDVVGDPWLATLVCRNAEMANANDES